MWREWVLEVRGGAGTRLGAGKAGSKFHLHSKGLVMAQGRIQSFICSRTK